ncbi:MAG: glutamate-5-semialdehyde dehydrogenase, partial [Rectinemataceae bacterium]
MSTREKAEAGKSAATAMLGLDLESRNHALTSMATALRKGTEEVARANAEDLEDARREGLPAPLLSRLHFGDEKIEASIAGLEALRALPDPLGRQISARRLDEGLVLRQLSCPIGLIAMIFESRPDALVQMAALCAKSGNAVLLKGGSEASRTNRALAALILDAGMQAGLPPSWLSLLESRAEVAELLVLDELVDLLVPRGSKEFVARIKTESRIPVLGHADGICHLYLHSDAELAMASALAVDSKTQYPAACNAAEVLLVHSDFAPKGLPRVVAALESAGVAIECCPRSAAILGRPSTMPESGSWAVEYLDLRMAVRIVDSLD